MKEKRYYHIPFSRFYILKDKKPVQCNNLIEWGECMEDINKRTVKRTKKRNITISTVFLGYDCSFDEREKQLFETAVLVDKEFSIERRYATWKEAEKGHNEICNQICFDSN